MPTYYLRYPENPEERAVLSNLIGSLEKMFSIVTFDAIGVVLPVGDPAGELVRSLARDVIAERPTFAELVDPGGTISAADLIMEREGPEVFIPAPEITLEDDRVACAECGELFLPRRKDSRYCSPKCYSRGYQKGVAAKGSVSKTGRNGSGVKIGKVVGRAN